MPEKPRYRRIEEWDPKQVYFIAKLFFDGVKAWDIRDTTNEKFRLVGKAQWTHQNVFSAVVRAREMGWVRFSPPVEAVLASDLQRVFKLRQMPIVVQPPSPRENHLVAEKGAESAFEFILERQEDQLFEDAQVEPVSIGLGVGRASLDFARHLAELIQGHKFRSRIKLNLHAITALISTSLRATPNARASLAA